MEDYKNISREPIFHITPRPAEEGNHIGCCPACQLCTSEPRPDLCSRFRNCRSYRRWLRCTWELVTAPFRTARQPRIADATT